MITVALVVATYAYTRWKLRHMRPTAATGARLLWWGSFLIVVNALETASYSREGAIFWNQMQHIGIAPIPLLWLHLALQLAGRDHLLTRRRWLALMIVPGVCLLALVTNRYHYLFVTSFQVEVTDTLVTVRADPGPFMILLYLYGYILVALGAYVMAQKLLRSNGYRWQAGMVLLAVSLPVGANVLDWSGLNPFPYVRLTPLALGVSIPLFVLTLLWARRADILPVACSNVIYSMHDPVIVLDIENHILSLNPAAETILGRPLAESQGRLLDDVWPDWAKQMINTLSRSPGSKNELELGENDQKRTFDVRRSDLHDWHGQLLGRVIVLRDITARIQSETKLRFSEEHFRALTENAEDVVVIVDSNVVIRYASPSLSRLSGLSMSDIVGKTAISFIHPDDVKNILAAFDQAITTAGASAPITARFRHADGYWRLLECAANNMLEHPAVQGIVVNARDVTEQVEAEERLRLSEWYFRALIENSTDVTMIVTPDGMIQYASPSLMRIFGRRWDEIVGRNSLEFIHPDDVELVMSKLPAAMMAGNSFQTVTARFPDKAGNWHLLECRATNLLDHPAVQGIVINARDVTEREVVAQALSQSEERYRLHFAHLNDVVYSFDSQIRVLTVSPSVERHLGFKPEEFVGKSIVELDVLAQEYVEQAIDQARQVLQGASFTGAIYEFIAKDGTRRIAEISASPVYEDNRVTSVINVARDITERIHAEERLRASLAEKEILLKEIHHRVKNNMQVIASLLSLQAGATVNPALRIQFEDSQNRIRSMALVHERLYRSQNLVSIDFKEYLHDLTGHLMHSYRAQSKGVTLTVVADDNIQLDVDTAVPCGLMVSELVSNALKHAFPSAGSGTVGVEMHMETCSSHAQYQLIVHDDGIGLPADLEPHKTVSLGLQLVHSLTRQLGGTVTFHTSPGTQVTICFNQPAAEATQ